MKYILLLLTLTAFADMSYLLKVDGRTVGIPKTLSFTEPTYYYDDLAGWWKLQGDALDYSRNDNDGTVYGAVSTGTNYYFDGVNDYIDCGNLCGRQYTNNFTICAWFSTTESGRDHRIIAQRNSGGASFDLYVRDATVRLTLGSGYSSASISANDGSQKFVAMSFYDNVVSGYYNGTYIFTRNLDGAGVSDNIQIGRLNISPYSWDFEGYIWDVRIYDRTLTATEIQQIYNE